MPEKEREIESERKREREREKGGMGDGQVLKFQFVLEYIAVHDGCSHDPICNEVRGGGGVGVAIAPPKFKNLHIKYKFSFHVKFAPDCSFPILRWIKNKQQNFF